MIQPRNYCTQALEQFMTHDFGFRADAPVVFDADLEREISVQSHECAGLLHDAEKFLMPEWGRIFDAQELEVVSDMVVPNRLPYPIIACEYLCDYAKHDTMIPGELPSSKRIALLVEKETLKLRAPQTWRWIAATKPIGDAVLTEEGFFTIPVCYFDLIKIWSPAPAFAFSTRSERPQDLSVRLVITPLGVGSYNDYPDEEKHLRAQRDIADESICAAHLLLALAMERTTMTTLPAPAKLNKKRTRNGRPPIFEYKVLDIVADIMDAPRTVSGKPPVGHHASPRMHKRRGHVRRLSESRVTWVRNTIVGKPTRGEIRKDYSVHKETTL